MIIVAENAEIERGVMLPLLDVSAALSKVVRARCSMGGVPADLRGLWFRARFEGMTEAQVELAIASAVRDGRLDVLRLLHSLDAAVPSNEHRLLKTRDGTVASRALWSAAWDGNRVVALFAASLGVPLDWEAACVGAAAGGYTDLLRLFVALMREDDGGILPKDSKACRSAAHEGHLETVRYALSAGFPYRREWLPKLRFLSDLLGHVERFRATYVYLETRVT